MCNSINKRINEIALKIFGGNNVEFAKKVGSSEANIRNYRKNTLPKADFLEEICDKIEICCDWLLLGEGEMLRKGPSKAEEPPEPNKKEEKCEQCKQCAEKDKLIQTLQSAINVQNKYIECLEDKNSGACEKKSKKDTTTIPYISNNI